MPVLADIAIADNLENVLSKVSNVVKKFKKDHVVMVLVKSNVQLNYSGSDYKLSEWPLSSVINPYSAVYAEVGLRINYAINYEIENKEIKDSGSHFVQFACDNHLLASKKIGLSVGTKEGNSPAETLLNKIESDETLPKKIFFDKNNNLGITITGQIIPRQGKIFWVFQIEDID